MNKTHFAVLLVILTMVACRPDGPEEIPLPTKICVKTSHHGQPIPNARVYVKYNADSFPGYDQPPSYFDASFNTGADARFGLNSPRDRAISRGEYVTMAYGTWGALTCRAGWLAADAGDLPEPVRDYAEKLAGPYFAAVAAWYDTIGLGVTGGEIDAVVKRVASPHFRPFLNPGHLIHLDEWLSTPIYPGSSERLVSGQALQCDIIPVAPEGYFSSNMEEGVVLLDAAGRDAFRDRYPGAWQRIEARRAFMADQLGIRLKPEILPLSNSAGYLPPFFLSPGRVFVRS